MTVTTAFHDHFWVTKWKLRGLREPQTKEREVHRARWERWGRRSDKGNRIAAVASVWLSSIVYCQFTRGSRAMSQWKSLHRVMSDLLCVHLSADMKSEDDDIAVIVKAGKCRCRFDLPMMHFDIICNLFTWSCSALNIECCTIIKIHHITRWI